MVLRDIAFRAPFSVRDDEERDLCVRLQPNGKHTAFSILGRPNAEATEWQEYATGFLETSGEDQVPTADLAAIRRRCVAHAAVYDTPRRTSHLDFGPRWDVVRRIDYGEKEAVVSLELRPEFTGDLEDYRLHPALLDMATGSAQELVAGFDERTDFYVPLSYGSLLARAPLTGRLQSHVRLGADTDVTGEFVSFDVTIYDESGRALVEVSDFVMMRVRDGQMLAPAAHPGRPVHFELMESRSQGLANQSFAKALQQGIATTEGMDAIDRILTHRVPPHLVVTPRDITVLLAEAEQGTDRSADRREAASGTASPAAPSRDLASVAVALEALPSVQEAAACDHRDQSGQLRVVAYVVFADGEQATQSELRRACKANLDSSFVPQAFVELEAIPRAPDGTVLFSALANPYGVAEEAPAPETPTEQVIGQLWQELLGLSRVGRYDNFFDIGGHSLLSLRFLARLEKRSGIRLLHEHVVASTLQQLAAKVDQLGGKVA
jgi:hypothetical protein